MASYHLSVKAINRKDGRSSVAAAAYRAGARLTNNRDGQIHDFSRRKGVLASFIMAPEWAPAWVYDREMLWNTVEAGEKRKDSKTAREFEIALPSEIGDAAREALVRQFVSRLQREFPGVYDIAIHRPDESQNYHAHILASTRALDRREFGATFGAKFSTLDSPKTSGAIVEQLRTDFAAMQNAALEAARVSERVDHRSYARQGIDKIPGRHMGPVRTAIARRQVAMERAARVARHVATRMRVGPRRARPAAPIAGQSYGWARRSMDAARRALAVPQALRFSPAHTVAAAPAVAPPAPVLVALVPTQAPPPMPLFRPMPSFWPTVLPAAQPGQHSSDGIDYSPS